METETLRELIAAAFFSTCAIAVAFASRNALRALFGPAVAYNVWLLVPTALVAVILPVHRDTPIYLNFIGSALPLSQYLDTPTGSAESPTVAIFLFAWAAGTALTLLVLLRQQVRFVRSLGMVDGSDGILYARSGGPLVFGIVRPRIVVPLDFEYRYTPTEQQVVLAHERMHLRRGDPIANAICAFLRCTFWFNPLVHFAANRFRFDQELACDEAVIRRNPSCQRLYANAMLKTHTASAQLPLACHWPTRHPLKARIMMLRKPAFSGGRRALGSLLTGVGVIVIGYGVWAAQPGHVDSPGDSSLSERSHLSGDASSARVMRDERSALLARGNADSDSSALLNKCHEDIVLSRRNGGRSMAPLAIALTALHADVGYISRGVLDGVDDLAENYARGEREATESNRAAGSARFIIVVACERVPAQESLASVLLRA